MRTTHVLSKSVNADTFTVDPSYCVDLGLLLPVRGRSEALHVHGLAVHTQWFQFANIAPGKITGFAQAGDLATHALRLGRTQTQNPTLDSVEGGRWSGTYKEVPEQPLGNLDHPIIPGVVIPMDEQLKAGEQVHAKLWMKKSPPDTVGLVISVALFCERISSS